MSQGMVRDRSMSSMSQQICQQMCSEIIQIIGELEPLATNQVR